MSNTSLFHYYHAYKSYIFVPELSLALEYQGESHYKDNIFGSSERRSHCDLEKKEMCAKYGITLVEIPHWWDSKIESLQATLYPEL
jgi:hypothetical protein